MDLLHLVSGELAREPERFGLTPAQARVAALLARGLSHRAVAKELNLSPHTVRRHSEQIRIRLGVRNKTEMTARLMSELSPRP